MKLYSRYVFNCENCSFHIETQEKDGKCPKCGLKYEIRPIEYKKPEYKKPTDPNSSTS